MHYICTKYKCLLFVNTDSVFLFVIPCRFVVKTTITAKITGCQDCQDKDTHLIALTQTTKALYQLQLNFGIHSYSEACGICPSVSYSVVALQKDLLGIIT